MLFSLSNSSNLDGNLDFLLLFLFSNVLIFNFCVFILILSTIVSVSSELSLPCSRFTPSISTSPSFFVFDVFGGVSYSSLQAFVQVFSSISWVNCFLWMIINIAKQVQSTLTSFYQQCPVLLFYILKVLWKMGYLHSCQRSSSMCIPIVSNIWWWPSFRSMPQINNDFVAWPKRFFILTFWVFSFFSYRLQWCSWLLLLLL